jgi:HEAT repeat protein
MPITPEAIAEFAAFARGAPEPYRSIGAAVAAEAAVLVLIAVAVLLVRTWRGFIGLLRRAVEHRYGIYVMEASIERLHDDSPILRASWLSRIFLKGYILSKILRIGGTGRSGLADLYARMGFLVSDVAGLSSRRWWLQVGSCMAIGLAGDRALAARVRPLLGDRREAVRIAAARALARLDTPAAAPDILAAMPGATEWGAARLAGLVAGMGQPAFDHVKGAVEACADPAQRARLVDIVGKIGDTRGVSALMGLLKDPDQEIRIRAAKALGVVPDRRASVALVRALEDESWEVRAQAAKSLGRICDEETVAPLSARLDDKNWWVRYNSAHALAALGGAGKSELERTVTARAGFARDIALQVIEMQAQGVLEQ